MHVRRNLISPRTLIASSILALTLTACKSSPPPPDDASLTSAVRSRIAGDAAISAEPIQSSVQGGVATLTGTVSTEAARSLAASDASQITGIRTVVNNLSVQAIAPPAAAVIPPPAPAPPPPASKKAPAPKSPAQAKTTPAPIVRQEPLAPEVAEQSAPPPPQLTPGPPPPPPPPPAPSFRNITIPAGTTIPVRITQTLDSATTQQGDTFSGVIATDVLVDDVVVLQHGTPVSGRVSAVQEAAHYKGNSLLTVELTSIDRRGERLPVAVEPYSVQGKGRGKNTAEKVGGGAAVGAILGGILGGGKGAAIGAAAGGGVGAGANTITRGEQVQIASESLIRFELNSPIALRVPTRRPDRSPDDTDKANPGLQPGPKNQ